MIKHEKKEEAGARSGEARAEQGTKKAEKVVRRLGGMSGPVLRIGKNVAEWSERLMEVQARRRVAEVGAKTKKSAGRGNSTTKKVVTRIVQRAEEKKYAARGRRLFSSQASIFMHGQKKEVEKNSTNTSGFQ